MAQPFKIHFTLSFPVAEDTYVPAEITLGGTADYDEDLGSVSVSNFAAVVKPLGYSGQTWENVAIENNVVYISNMV